MWLHKYRIHLIDKFITLGLMALVFVVPLAYSSKVGEIALYPKFLILAVIVSILSLLWLIKLLTEKTTLSFSTPMTLPILFFLIINIVSLNAAVNIYASLFPLAQLFTMSILFFIIVNNINLKRIYLVTRVWVFVGGLVSIIGIGQYLGFGFDWIPSAGNPSSTFAYRNMAAMFLILTVPISGLFFLKSRRIKNHLLWGFTTTLLITYLIYTRTRGAWLGFTGATIITIISLLWIRRIRTDLFSELKKVIVSKRKGILGIIFILIISFMASLEPNIKDRSFGEGKSEIITTAFSILKDGGDSGRIGIWKASFDMLKDNLNWLTGIGLNNFQLIYPYYSFPKDPFISLNTITTRPHNDYLWILTEMGLLGLGIYIWLLISAGRMIFAILKRSVNAGTVLLTTALMTSLSAILIHAMFSFPKERIAISMLFWLILAFISYIYKNLIEHSADTYINPINSTLIISWRPKYRQRVFLIIIVIIISLGSLEIGRRYFLSGVYYKNLNSYLKKENYKAMVSNLNQIESKMLYNWRIPYFIGIAYQKLGNYPSSISYFKRCLESHPYFLSAHFYLGQSYFESGNYLNAIKHYTLCVTLFPRLKETYPMLAQSWKKIGNLEKAEIVYRTLLEFEPENPRAHNDIGAILAEKELYEEAQFHFQLALEIDPDLLEAENNLKTLMKLKSD